MKKKIHVAQDIDVVTREYSSVSRSVCVVLIEMSSSNIVMRIIQLITEMIVCIDMQLQYWP